MNQLGKGIDTEPSVPNTNRVALAINGTHAVADAASEAGLHASHHKLTLT